MFPEILVIQKMLAGIYECVRRSCSAKLLLEDKSLYLLKWVKGRTSAEHDNTKS